MSFFGDVLEYIIDGTSGLSPGDVSGAGMAVGVCSLGEVGKGYLLCPQSDIEGLLGVGPLVDRLKDLFQHGGQECYIVAVPATGDTAGECGEVTHDGTGTATFAASGTILKDADALIEILTGGALADGIKCRYSIDGGNSWDKYQTIPVGGALTIEPTGAIITFADAVSTPEGSFVVGDTYAFATIAPVASLTNVMTAIDYPLAVYDVEFVYVVGASDSTDWATMGAKAEELWNDHRPTFFICEAALPGAEDTIDDWVAALVDDADDFAHSWVVVNAGFGKISMSDGHLLQRNTGGILTGLVSKIPVMRSVGNVQNCSVSNVVLPALYTNAHAKALDDAGYCTLRTYAGLSALFYSNGRTQADVISDYQFIEVLRTTFKAIRLSRIAALKSMQLEATTGQLAKCKADVEQALNTMVAAIPQELDHYLVTIPPNQDIVNNGLAIEEDLYGIPIIRTIKLFFRYYYNNPTAA